MKRKRRIICFCLAAVMLWTNVTVGLAKTDKCPQSLYLFNKSKTISIVADDVPAYSAAAGTTPKYKVRLGDSLKIGVYAEKNILNNKKNTEGFEIVRNAMKITVSNPKVLKIKEIKIPKNIDSKKQVILEAVGIGDCNLNIKVSKTAVSKKASFTIPIHVGIKAPKLLSAKSSKKGQVVLKWEESKGAKYYEVEYSTKKSDLLNSDHSSNYNMKKLKQGKVSASLKGLKSGKTYYINITAWDYDVKDKNGKVKYHVSTGVPGKILKVKVK